MTSTLTARFMPSEDYLKEFCLPQFSERKYVEFLEDQHQYARGVVVEFGGAVVKHWLEIDAYFDQQDSTGAAEQLLLDQLVASKLAALFGSTSPIPVKEFLDL